jgi:hypothetical protein
MCMYIYIYISVYLVHICTYPYLYTHKCIYIYICIYYICTYILYLHIHIDIFIYVNANDMFRRAPFACNIGIPCPTLPNPFLPSVSFLSFLPLFFALRPFLTCVSFPVCVLPSSRGSAFRGRMGQNRSQ